MEETKSAFMNINMNKKKLRHPLGLLAGIHPFAGTFGPCGFGLYRSTGDALEEAIDISTLAVF